MTGIRKFEVDINGQKVKCCGFAGNDSNTTNNKMELNAIMCSIKLIYTQFSIPVDAVIHTDSKYCINSLTGGDGRDRRRQADGPAWRRPAVPLRGLFLFARRCPFPAPAARCAARRGGRGATAARGSGGAAAAARRPGVPFSPPLRPVCCATRATGRRRQTRAARRSVTTGGWGATPRRRGCRRGDAHPAGGQRRQRH